jgi:hypothetical protein
MTLLEQLGALIKAHGYSIEHEQGMFRAVNYLDEQDPGAAIVFARGVTLGELSANLIDLDGVNQMTANLIDLEGVNQMTATSGGNE